MIFTGVFFTLHNITVLNVCPKLCFRLHTLQQTYRRSPSTNGELKYLFLPSLTGESYNHHLPHMEGIYAIGVVLKVQFHHSISYYCYPEGTS